MAKLHDQFYNRNPDSKTRKRSEAVLAQRAEEIANDLMTDEPQGSDVKLVKTLMKNKARLGMGLKKGKKTSKN